MLIGLLPWQHQSLSLWLQLEMRHLALAPSAMLMAVSASTFPSCIQLGFLSFACLLTHSLIATSATICYDFVYVTLAAWCQPSSVASTTYSLPVKGCLTEDVFLSQTFSSCYMNNFLCNFKISIIACPGWEENILIFLTSKRT